MRTAAQIIDFVVWYYSRYPRAIDNGSCVYLTEDKRRCAHSIFIQSLTDVSGHSEQINALSLIELLGDDIHRPKYRGHSKKFWSFVQHLHDEPANWDDYGITKWGIKVVKEIKNRFK